MKLTISIFLLTCSFFGNASTTDSVKILTLHPSVGKMIDRNEKNSFHLFPEYNDSLFESAEVLKYNDSTYTIRFRTTAGKEFEKPVTTNDLDLMYSKVDAIKPVEYVDTNHNKSNAEADRERDKERAARNSYWVGEMVVQMVVITLEILVSLAH